jgi:CheY-like chemotaxis protein
VGCKTVNTQGLASLQFCVKDTGIGIPAERQQAVFERFIKADIVDKDARQGSGLGLSITKAYVEMLGGKIWVESQINEGSTFFFTLPLNEQVHAKTGDLNLEEKTGQITGLNIVIAEDDETSALYLQTILQTVSSKIRLTKNGNETVESCRNNPDIDLVLMDIQMPDMNGYDATRRIREFNKEVVIIAQTAFALAGDREKAMEAGCNDYISKPIQRNELVGMIEKYFKV